MKIEQYKELIIFVRYLLFTKTNLKGKTMKITIKQENRSNYPLVTILFSLIMLSVLSHAEFSKKGNIVIDSITKLQWQDDTISSIILWEAAITYCENLSLDGYSNWRLPNIKELFSLIDDSKTNPAIDSIFEHTATLNSYWSSTTTSIFKGGANIYNLAQTVNFKDGIQYYDAKRDLHYVRCVRAEQ